MHPTTYNSMLFSLHPPSSSSSSSSHYLNPASKPWHQQDQNQEEMGMADQENCGDKIFLRLAQQSFHAVSLTLLSLLHPLSFLLLSRLSSPLLPLTPNSIILLTLISSLSFSSLFSSITGRALRSKPPTAVAWILLCLCQACITLGIETTIRDGFKPLQNAGTAGCETWLKRYLLFVGIYDQTVLWKRKLVKPVVDDAVYKEERKERGAERLVMGVSFGVLWLWLLQGEVRPLVLATGKGGLRKTAGWSGTVIWAVTSATLMTGFVRAVELLVWVVGVALQLMRRREKDVEEEEEGMVSVANVV